MSKNTIAVAEFVAMYSEMAEVDCVDGFYSRVGAARSTRSLLDVGAESIEIVEPDLQGWGYAIHAVVDFGVGHKMSIFAR